MLRLAEPGDRPALERFLALYPDTSMFLSSNLEGHGIGVSDHPHATDFWIWGEGAIKGVFGLTNGGYGMCQMPDPSEQAGRAFANATRGRTFQGLTGHAGQVGPVLEALGLARADWQLQRDEPLYSMDLSDIQAPEGSVLRRVCEADLDTLKPWWAWHEVDTGLAEDGPNLADGALTRAETTLSSPDFRVFEENGQLVGMTNLNARTRDMVQIGGVFVPRAFRCKGVARRMVSAQLAEARDHGAARAILFAANPEAARVYEAVGFRLVGRYSLNLLKQPLILGEQT